MPLLVFAGLTGFAVVALGAFGAHGLEESLSPAAKGWWETATFYGLTNAVAALAVALYGRVTTNAAGPRFTLAGVFFLVGVLLFSGSLYAMAFFSINASPPRWLGPITPLGGVSFLIGWAAIIVTAIRRGR